MVRKWSVFFRRVRRLLKYVQARVHRRGTLLILLAMFLGTGALPPTNAYIVAQNAIVQNLPDAQELVQQGTTLYKAERFNDAALVFQQAATAFKTTGDGLRQVMTLSNVSLCYQQLGQWSQADQALAESLLLLHTGRNMGNSTEQMQILAQTLDVQGRLQLAQGQAYPALTTWLKASDTYAQVGDDAGVTRSRINSAQALQALGLYRQAQKTLTESTQLLQKEPGSPLKVTGLRSLGNVLRVVGDLEQSRQILQQSLEVALASQSPEAISDALLSLGNTALAQQDTQAALKYYQQAASASATPTTLIQAQLNQLSILLEDKQLSAAQALGSQIQAGLPNLPPSRKAVYARINFAQSLMKLLSGGVGGAISGAGGAGGAISGAGGAGESSSILPLSPHPLLPLTPRGGPEFPLSYVAQLLATAVQQAKSIKDPRAEAYALGHLGGLYEQTQQFRSANDLTQQALLLAQSINAPDISYRWQWQLGRLLKAQGRTKEAIAAYTESVKNLQSLRNDLVAINQEIQFSFRDEVEPIYRQLVDLLLQSESGSQPSQENLVEARSVIESLQLAELDNF